MKQGLFIVIDGLGGSGKSTQIELLKQRLPQAVFTKEPGGAPRAEKIRDILKQGEKEADALSDFFLFWAGRSEHMTRLIKPAISHGKTVVCDRFDSSTYAMQVRGDEQANLEKFFWECRTAVLNGFEPDIYIFLDIDPKEAESRRVGREKGEDRFDERDIAYQQRVREGYKEFAQHVGAEIIDASGRVEDTSAAIWRAIEKKIR